ncbi:MAG: AMP-binding protein [Phycisphaeraceae bacterium]|nr:AMP-binding protein [Phycisphaeraceae bacterium]MCW5753435.1 AMP-binding protein [Phycisphaeraceae bacterium]
MRRSRQVLIVDDRRSYRGIEILVAATHVASEIERVSGARSTAILVPASGAFPIAALAAWMLGRTVVPLNFLLAREELQYVIDDCETDTVVTVGPMLDHLGYTPQAENIILLDQIEFRRFPELRWPARAGWDDLAALLYTSGTSGKPKGVMLSHGNILSNVRQVLSVVPFSREESLLGVLPQFHSFGFTVLTVLPLMVGMKAVYQARFQPTKVLQAMREHRPQFFVGIPSMYNALLNVKSAKADDFASFRYLISGGEPLPRDVADRFKERFGKPIREGYGLTETSPVTHVCREGAERDGTVGRGVTDVLTRIVDLDRQVEVPPGRDGEIRLKGPNIFKGYWKLPDESAAAFDAEGWFRTGDIGRLDADGLLAITGRHKEMMIVGGENVFPREIEEVLNRHPAVQASGVIGVMDPIRGEVPVAFIEIAEGAEFDESALRSHCREHLAGYKVPRDIRPVESLPRNPTGKIMRRQLKSLL